LPHEYFWTHTTSTSTTTTVIRLPGFCPVNPKKHSRTHTVTPIVVIKIIPYLLPPSIMIQGILPVELTYLTAFFHNHCPNFLGLPPSTSYSIHFFNQSLSSFSSTCPYHHSLFCCSTKIMSSKPSLSQPFTWNYIRQYDNEPKTMHATKFPMGSTLKPLVVKPSLKYKLFFL